MSFLVADIKSTAGRQKIFHKNPLSVLFHREKLNARVIDHLVLAKRGYFKNNFNLRFFKHFNV
jgi:hypothetical protein